MMVGGQMAQFHKNTISPKREESTSMTQGPQKIIYTLTDEAPRLATEAFLPVLRTFAEPAGIAVETSDISVAARILGAFPERLTDEQKVQDNLAELGRLTQDPDTNIIKLPNISASVPQLTKAITELQSQGYDIPDFPWDPQTDEEKETAKRYSGILGSAVNPVLRQGNSDRRAPKAVKEYAKANPHSMGKWSMASQTHVAHMTHGDFYAGEKSIILDRDCDARMEVVTPDGKTEVLKTVPLQKGTVVDSMFMSKKALLEFYEEQLNDAKETGVMFSLHVKATMMKVSHPIVFGHAVRVFYKDAFEKSRSSPTSQAAVAVRHPTPGDPQTARRRAAAVLRSSEVRSTRSYARATPTVVPRRPSRSTPRPTRTPWASGPWPRRPTSRT